EEERRPEVEPEAVALDRRAPPADARQTLDDVDLEAAAGEQERRRQPARTSPDDEHGARAAAGGRSRGRAGDGGERDHGSSVTARDRPSWSGPGVYPMPAPLSARVCEPARGDLSPPHRDRE